MCCERGVAYTLQGTPPTVTAMSSFDAVSRSFPVMVITVPPAAGPFAGWTRSGLGSCMKKINELMNLNIIDD